MRYQLALKSEDSYLFQGMNEEIIEKLTTHEQEIKKDCSSDYNEIRKLFIKNTLSQKIKAQVQSPAVLTTLFLVNDFQDINIHSQLTLAEIENALNFSDYNGVWRKEIPKDLLVFSAIDSSIDYRIPHSREVNLDQEKLDQKRGDRLSRWKSLSPRGDPAKWNPSEIELLKKYNQIHLFYKHYILNILKDNFQYFLNSHLLLGKSSQFIKGKKDLDYSDKEKLAQEFCSRPHGDYFHIKLAYEECLTTLISEIDSSSKDQIVQLTTEEFFESIKNFIQNFKQLVDLINTRDMGYQLKIAKHEVITKEDIQYNKVQIAIHPDLDDPVTRDALYELRNNYEELPTLAQVILRTKPFSFHPLWENEYNYDIQTFFYDGEKVSDDEAIERFLNKKENQNIKYRIPTKTIPNLDTEESQAKFYDNMSTALDNFLSQLKNFSHQLANHYYQTFKEAMSIPANEMAATYDMEQTALSILNLSKINSKELSQTLFEYPIFIDQIDSILEYAEHIRNAEERSAQLMKNFNAGLNIAILAGGAGSFLAKWTLGSVLSMGSRKLLQAQILTSLLAVPTTVFNGLEIFQNYSHLQFYQSLYSQGIYGQLLGQIGLEEFEELEGLVQETKSQLHWNVAFVFFDAFILYDLKYANQLLTRLEKLTKEEVQAFKLYGKLSKLEKTKVKNIIKNKNLTKYLKSKMIDDPQWFIANEINKIFKLVNRGQLTQSQAMKIITQYNTNPKLLLQTNVQNVLAVEATPTFTKINQVLQTARREIKLAEQQVRAIKESAIQTMRELWNTKHFVYEYNIVEKHLKNMEDIFANTTSESLFYELINALSADSGQLVKFADFSRDIESTTNMKSLNHYLNEFVNRNGMNVPSTAISCPKGIPRFLL